MEATKVKPPDLTGFSREAVEAISDTRDEPSWVRDARVKAWETYESIPMPKRNDEEWRRTDLRRLKLDRFAPYAKLDADVSALTDFATGDRMEAMQLGETDQRSGVIASRDSGLPFVEVDPSLAEKGVIFTDLNSAVHDHPELIQKYFMTRAVPVDFGKFEALHAAMWQGGAFLYVPKDVSVELPFRSFAFGDTAGASIFTHSLIVLEENAEAFFVDAYQSGTQDEASFASAVVELILGENAQLRYVQVQDWGRHVWNFMTERSTLARGAEMKNLQVTLGSKFSKNSIGSHLQGENTLAEMLGIFFADGDQFFDHHTWQLHESPYATSDLEYKGAMKEKSRSVYSGLIKVSEGAQRTDAYQQNRNLILSKTARADTIPNLEIEANDVRCTHGATISQVEDEHLFYLMARGIPKSEAQKLIVEGFFRPVIDRIPVEEIQDFLQGAIARKVGY